MDNFSINEENREDNLVRDFSCALCAWKQAKIRMTPAHQPRLAVRHVSVCWASVNVSKRSHKSLSLNAQNHVVWRV